MKKLISTLGIAAMVSSSLAQNAEHLYFEGTTIDGTITEYAQKLEEQGFAILTTSRCYGLASGSVGDLDDCLVHFESNGDNDVCSVVVFTADAADWMEFQSAFDNAVQTCKDKYGQPQESEDQSSQLTISHDEAFKLLLQNQLKKYCAFTTDKGYVSVNYQPSPREQGKISITITYIDHKNTNASKYSCNSLKIDDIPVLSEYATVEKMFKERNFNLLTATEQFKFWTGNFDIFGQALFIVQTDNDNFVSSFYVDLSECDAWQIAKENYNTLLAYLKTNYTFYDEIPLAENGAKDDELFQTAKNSQLKTSYFAKRKDGNIVKLFMHSGFIDKDKVAIMIEVFDN